MARYLLDELQFEYPSEWQLTEEQTADGQSVMVSSSGTAFCSIVVMPDRPPVATVLKSAVAAFEESYDDIETEAVECTLAGRPARGIDVDFYCLELLNVAWLRAFRTGRHTVFLLFEAGFDEPNAREIFDGICNSLECNAEVGA
jgi:hypothetical protein